MSDYAIRVKDVSKMYKLYNRNRDRVMDAFGLSKEPRYREHYALNELSFDVERGETVGIIGTNGAGKSTILKIITGVLNPTSGDVEIDGRISALLELGAGFNQEYTGIENVYLNGTMMGYTREEIDQKMDDILKFADIGDFVYQPVKTYSSGMFVRLAFAVAINIDPEILIVDEALSVGDVFFQNKCYKKFDDFKKLGKTILFVSHDLGSISKYCDRVVLLDHGKKLSEGSPKDMIDIYKKLMTGTAVEDALAVSKVNDIDESGKNDEKSYKAHSIIVQSDDSSWRTHFTINPNLNEYGSKKAEIIDFAIVDNSGLLTNSIIKGDKFTIKSKVKFNEDIDNPIFTYTFKSVKGVDITGTNTMYEKKYVEHAYSGEVYVASFTQKMNLQGGEYLLSISCTGYGDDGGLVAYHRLYDLLNITVVSDKNTVGFYDMNSEVSIVKVEQ
ncbi:MAG TPA: ABC transporter ATP-binding protein [Lachnospiraceae bacterium]|nr:ABC transporter ATP-binding protein [Lachnospiraceae bacterium]